MGTVFLTAVAAEHGGTQRVAKEFSETLFTSEAADQRGVVNFSFYELFAAALVGRFCSYTRHHARTAIVAITVLLYKTTNSVQSKEL